MMNAGRPLSQFPSHLRSAAMTGLPDTTARANNRPILRIFLSPSLMAFLWSFAEACTAIVVAVSDGLFFRKRRIRVVVTGDAPPHAGGVHLPLAHTQVFRDDRVHLAGDGRAGNSNHRNCKNDFTKRHSLSFSLSEDGLLAHRIAGLFRP